MRVLIACEFSGITRQAYRQLGHDAWSCDVLDAEDNSPHHLKGDVRQWLNEPWDLMIAHPPCTYLAVSGARWFKDRQAEQQQALDFVRLLMSQPYPWAIENPVSVISTSIRKPDQIIHPWMFGHGETKTTCLWLHRLPRLKATEAVTGRETRIHYMSPGPQRSKERSRSYPGIAQAMAAQWNQDSIELRQADMFSEKA